MSVGRTAFDVVVVGAGPAGSVFAEALARASFRVALLEEHPSVGLPDHCSGLVSPRTLEVAGVAEEAVGLDRFSGARIWGPGGKILWVQSDSVQAVAIDRPRFDQILADRAASAGAALMLETKAHRFERLDGGIGVGARRRQGDLYLQAPLLVGADGAGSRVARWIGRTQAEEVIPAMKGDISFRRRGTDSIEIFVGNGVAPGWFGWVIPLPGGEARIGVGTTQSLQACAAAYLDLIRHRFGDFDVRQMRQASIPLGPARDFVADGVMLVGAAARQTKPTTGGGLYLATRAAQLGAATAARALAQGDCSGGVLRAYERDWHRLEGREVRVGHWLRQLFRRLSDRELELILEVVGEPWAQRLIACRGDIDFPSGLLSSLVAAAVRRAVPPKARRAWQLIGDTVECARQQGR